MPKLIPVVDFKTFVAQQDPERTIDHSAWHRCAIGEYVEQHQIGRDHDTTCMDETDKFNLPDKVTEIKGDVTLYAMLEHGNSYVRDYDAGSTRCAEALLTINPAYDISTYGGLLAIINDCTED